MSRSTPLMSQPSTPPLMIIPGTRWAVKSVLFSKACVLHQRVTALLPPSLPLSNEPWLAVWRGTSSIHYTSSPIFGRCRAAQRLPRLAEPCLPASAPPSHLHLIHTCSSETETAEAFASPCLKDLGAVHFLLLCAFGALAKMPEANYLRSVSWGYIKVWFFWIWIYESVGLDKYRGCKVAKREQHLIWALCIYLRSLVVGFVSSWIDVFK